jgi:hypothetical protein
MRLVLVLRRAARVITQLYDRQMRSTGLRATQFTVLIVLALEGPLPLSMAADRMGTERTTLTRNLRALIARGLVTLETPDSGAIVTLPWAMIPGFLVPVFMLVHLTVFAQLAVRVPRAERLPLRSAA